MHVLDQIGLQIKRFEQVEAVERVWIEFAKQIVAQRKMDQIGLQIKHGPSVQLLNVVVA